jgi:hypothetical protein
MLLHCIAIHLVNGHHRVPMVSTVSLTILSPKKKFVNEIRGGYFLPSILLKQQDHSPTNGTVTLKYGFFGIMVQIQITGKPTLSDNSSLTSSLHRMSFHCNI